MDAQYLSESEFSRLRSFQPHLAAEAAALQYFRSLFDSDSAPAAAARDLALRVGKATTPFADAHLEADERERLQSNGSLPFQMPSGRPSFFESWRSSVALASLCLESGDSAGISFLCEGQPDTLDRIFSSNAQRVAQVAAKALRDPRSRPFGIYLLERLAPAAGSGSDDAWVSLIAAAAESRDLDLIRRAAALHLQACGRARSAWQMVREATPGHFLWEHLSDLESLGFAWPENSEIKRCAIQAAKMNPPDWERARWALSLWSSRRLAESKETDPADRIAAIDPMIWAASDPDYDAQPEWVDIALSLGSRVFAPSPKRPDRLPPAFALISKDYGIRRADSSKVLEIDEKIAALLDRMLSANPEGLSSRFEVEAPNVPGSRKTDAFTQCVARGYWQSAGVLLAHGAEWRPARRQISSLMFSGERKQACLAFFESLALREQSFKSSARRDRALAKKGIVAETVSRRPRSL